MKLKRRWILLLVSLLLLVAGWYLHIWLRGGSGPQLLGKVVRRVDTSEKVVALTYDDGPNPPDTERLLDVLAEHHAKATFFVVGRHIKDFPGVVEKIVAGGHDVGNHSWSHRPLTYLWPSEVREELDSTDIAIRDAGYTGTIQVRAPFGHKLFVFPCVLWQTNRMHILYSITVNDWQDRSPAEMLQDFDKAIKPGAIILLHDGNAIAPVHQEGCRKNTVELTRLILETYQPQGYRFVTVSELLGYEASLPGHWKSRCSRAQNSSPKTNRLTMPSNSPESSSISRACKCAA